MNPAFCPRRAFHPRIQHQSPVAATPTVARVRFHSWQESPGYVPGAVWSEKFGVYLFQQFQLLEPVLGHPAGSTMTLLTLDQLGAEIVMVPALDNHPGAKAPRRPVNEDVAMTLLALRDMIFEDGDFELAAGLAEGLAQQCQVLALDRMSSPEGCKR